jgi:hypothetical protein
MIPDSKEPANAPIPQIRRLMYYELQMRRALSILLVVFFGLGPLAATLGASEESLLPSCCRRSGAHHCAMSMRAMALLGSAPVFAAPSHCPSFPDGSSTTPPPSHALASCEPGMPFLLALPHSGSATRAAARLSQVRTRSGRAPPASLLA